MRLRTGRLLSHLCSNCTIDPEILDEPLTDSKPVCSRRLLKTHTPTYTHTQTLPTEYHSPLDAVKSMATVKLICVLEKGRGGGQGEEEEYMA